MHKIILSIANEDVPVILWRVGRATVDGHSGGSVGDVMTGPCRIGRASTVGDAPTRPDLSPSFDGTDPEDWDASTKDILHSRRYGKVRIARQVVLWKY
jgi:hypothetical protein